MPKVTLQEVGAGYSASTDLNANNATIETAFENTLSRDGTAPNQMGANLDMNSHRVINVTDAVNPQDAVTKAQLDALALVGYTDHGLMSGLADDDHPQYPLAAGTETISGQWEFTLTPTVGGVAVTLVGHNHNDLYFTEAEITTLLAGKSDTGHTHVAANVTDFSEAVDDRVASLLVAGTNITLTYNDAAGTITVDATGGGGVTDHGLLTGLGDDDHPQYAALAQNEVITGTWQLPTIELGHASDTTLSRIAAGRVAIEGLEIGYRNIPQNAQSGNYTCVLADSGKEIYHAVSTAAATYTIPANASVAYDIGTVLVFTNMSANNVTIAITSDTLYLIGTGATGSRTLAQYGSATARKLTATTWLISGTNLT